MASVIQNLIQRIFGVFNPITNQLIGFSTSGEGPVYPVVSAGLTTTIAGVRLLARTTTSIALTTGYYAAGDGGGGSEYSLNPSDTTSGAVFIGSVSGTTLTVSSVSSGAIAQGLSINRGDTGQSIGYVVSGGGTTWTLSASSTIQGPLLFTADNGGTILVAVDGGRWYLNIASNSWPSVAQFGVRDRSSGVQIDSTYPLQAALNAMPQGSGLFVPGGMRILINQAVGLTIPANITLKGPQSFVGTMTANSMSSPYHTMGGAIALSPSATITMNAGSCLDGLLVLNSGLTFPQVSPNYGGTAITYNADDCTVRNCMILGFGLGITSTNFQRPKCFDCMMDNLAGINFAGSQDTTHVERVHMWPFGTFYSGVTASNLQRSGTAFHNTSDTSGAKFIDCFSYGYNAGFLVDGATGEVGQTFINCWADNTATNFGTGFSIISGATDTKLLGCQASACATGYFFNTAGAGLTTTMVDCNAWGNGTHGVSVNAASLGNLVIRGGIFRSNPNAISVATASMGVDLDDMAIDNTNTLLFNITVFTTAVRIGSGMVFPNVAAGTQLIGTSTNVAMQNVASASVVSISPNVSDIFITGTTNVGSLNYGWLGRQVTLYFTGSLSVLHSTGAYNNLSLAGGVNFAVVSGSTLTLRHNGVQWIEIGRKA